MTQEEIRLSESGARKRHWKRWGPYLSERAWGTVREDYSAYGTAWEYLSHDHSRSRAYRWNEDGLAGVHRDALLAEAHFARAFDDEVDLLLLLVVPGHLAAVGLESHVPHRKIGRLDGAHAPDQILRAATRRIRAPGDLCKVSDDHVCEIALR